MENGNQRCKDMPGHQLQAPCGVVKYISEFGVITPYIEDDKFDLMLPHLPLTGTA
jgi:hypothetical protein